MNTKQIKLRFPERRHQAERFRKQELTFAQGLVNIMERLARRDNYYIRMLYRFADDNKGDKEINQMVKDAIDSVQHWRDESAQAASEDI